MNHRYIVLLFERRITQHSCDVPMSCLPTELVVSRIELLFIYLFNMESATDLSGTVLIIKTLAVD